MTKNSSNIELNELSSNKLHITPKPQGIDIVFKNISYSVNVVDQAQSGGIPCRKVYKKKQILKDISGIFKAGKCTAIMGASGAGKTTLLNVLACRIGNDKEGKLYANNLEYNYQSFGDFANYVMQSDVLMQTLTVRQTLQFAATLKLNLTGEQMKEKVIELTNTLKLQKCLDTLVGGVLLKGISGGERKRVSIAFQLISDPQVIYLDEPTSGLDSLTSYIIVSELKRLTRERNKTVIMTIHQPNSQTYALFDNLTLLLQGKIIYQDEAQKITSYFEKNFQLPCPQFINPSDFIMAKIHHQDENNRSRYSSYFTAYDKNEKEKIQKIIEQKNTSQIQFRQVQVGFFMSLKALLYRNVLNAIRNPMLLKSKIFQGIFIALFVGGMYFDIGTKDYTDKTAFYAVAGFLFFMTISGTMTSLAPITLTFPLERDVFFKQQDAKMYNVTTYFLSRNIVQIPEYFIIPLIIMCIYYFMIDLAGTTSQFFTHWLILSLMAFAGSAIGLLIGSVIMDAKAVSATVPIFLLPMFLFSGFFKNRGDLPDWIGWIQYISPLKYGFMAFVQNQTAHKTSLVSFLNFDLNTSSAIGILFALGIGFRFISLFFLWYLKKKNQ